MGSLHICLFIIYVVSLTLNTSLSAVLPLVSVSRCVACIAFLNTDGSLDVSRNNTLSFLWALEDGLYVTLEVQYLGDFGTSFSCSKE